MKPIARLARSILVGLLVCALPRVALADVRSEARRQFREGMAKIAAGDHLAGIEALKAAYNLMPHPSVLFNIGRAYVDVGKLPAGIEYLRRYVDTGPDDRKEVEATIATLEGRLAAMQAEAEQRLRAAKSAEASRGGGGTANAAQLEMLTRIADQVGVVAEATESASLFARTEELRKVIADLRKGGVAPASSATPVERPLATPVETPAVVTPGAEAAPSEIGEASDEDVYESKVVAASRFARTQLDAPNSTTIVTAQDIRLSGLTNIGELLRRAAGLEVMTLTPGDTEVSIRGLNQRLSNKVLVLVDGRSMYLDFLGATLWQSLPVNVEDIERIEIIRGPASAIYGADAMTGIINIVLHAPGEGESSVNAGGGNAGVARGAVGLSGKAGDLTYRLSGGYSRANEFSLFADPERVDLTPYADDPTLGHQSAHFGGQLAYRPAKGWEVNGGARVSANQFSFLGISRLRALSASNTLLSQSHLELQTPIGLSLRVFWNLWRNDADAIGAPLGGVPLSFDGLMSHVVDTELAWTQTFDFLVEHALAVGVGYRFKTIDWDWIGDAREEHHFSVFLEDTLRIGPYVLVALSGRVDRHPLLDELAFSPRVSVVVRPTDGIAIRALAGSAFRTPSFIESYLSLDNATPVRGVTAFGLGNTDLKPERLYSAEVGYAQEILDIISLEANGYFNVIFDQILLTRIQRYTLGEYPGFEDGASGFPVGLIQFQNEAAEFKQLGLEVGVRTFPVTGLDAYVNYSLHETTPWHTGVDLGGRELDRRTSTHKVNGGVQYRSPIGLDAAIDVHYVSEQTWVEQVTDANTGARFETFFLPSYFLLNARVGYRLFEDTLEVGVVGLNLTDKRHREHPFGERLGLRILGTATVRF